MGVMPVGRLLLSMSVPMVVSMLVQALYNIVDSMFVARLSEEALTAVSMAFPAQMLIVSVCGGTGVGMNALLSKSLGERNFAAANRTADNGLFLAVLTYGAFLLLGIFFVRPFFDFQTDIAEIAGDGIAYLRIVYLFSFGAVFQMAFERLLQATGKAHLSMAVQLIGAVTNLALDPIMIFGLLGFPRLGVAGAAIATVIGQMVAAAAGFYFNVKHNREISLSLSPRVFRPSLVVIGKIYAVGVPSILMASIGSVMTFGLNKILLGFTPTATAVVGVYFKLQSFVFMPVFGLNNGMVPIIAYNFGARRPERMKHTIQLAMIYATTIMLAGFAVFQLFTPQLFAIFNASASMLSIGVPALRKISLSFIFAGFCICSLSVCQALGHGLMSLVVSVVRQLVVLLPTAYVLSRLGGLDAIWWAFIVGELVSVVLCVLFLRRIYRDEIRPLAETAVTTDEGHWILCYDGLNAYEKEVPDMSEMKFIHERNRVYANNERGEMIAEVTFPDLPDGTVVIDHTFVDPLLRGHGAAASLMEEAYAEIKSQGRKTSATCPYAVAWFKKHPEKGDILLP